MHPEKFIKSEFIEKIFTYGKDISVRRFNLIKEIGQSVPKKVNYSKKIDQITLKSSTEKISDEPKTKTVREATKGDQAAQSLREKQISNITMILRFSNATPIQRHNELGFKCCFCDHHYKDAADLKQHTIGTHEPDVRKLNILRGEKDISRVVVKLDITELCCKICDYEIDTLELLFDHLMNKHSKPIFTDIKNPIVPFKFDSEVFRCFMCTKVYNKFKPLMQHMTTHYQNYVCEICEAGFLSKVTLLLHSEIHKIGHFKCEHCTKEFDTAQKTRAHIIRVHTTVNRYKCRFCNETFKHIHHKYKHLEEVHGVPYVGLKCKACDKVFASKDGLRTHTKMIHLNEKNHKCLDCDKSFFSLDQLRNHIVTHSGTREFQCEVCKKAYGRKKSLTQHMRIHEDDRRFKCEYCSQAFVQKCSWKSHMRSRHGDLV